MQVWEAEAAAPREGRRSRWILTQVVVSAISLLDEQMSGSHRDLEHLNVTFGQWGTGEDIESSGGREPHREATPNLQAVGHRFNPRSHVSLGTARCG